MTSPYENTPMRIAQKTGARRAMVVGVTVEAIIMIVNSVTSGMPWTCAHWLEFLIGLGLWSVSSMLFGLVCGSCVNSRATRNWTRSILWAFLFLVLTITFVVWRINIEVYVRPVVIQ